MLGFDEPGAASISVSDTPFHSHPEHWTIPISTAAGTFIAMFTRRGLAGLQFPGPGRVVNPIPPDRLPSGISRSAQLTERALQCWLRGANPVERSPLDFPRATFFQKKVWQVLMSIPWGRTLSYGEVARRVGHPGAARAVGSACGANPVPVFVPCHRVLPSHGGLGGFSGGLDWKRRLLAIEGVPLQGEV
jgi:O-6-methylguanine DNA methyltransferase